MSWALTTRTRITAAARGAFAPGTRGITLLTLAVLAVYLAHGIWAQLMFRTAAYDLSIFDQAIRAYAHFDEPLVPMKGPDYNIWADHFHPIIISIAPLYWIFNSPYVLIVVQALLVAASVPVVHRFTARRTEGWFALVVAGAYGLGWPVMTMIDFDFHEIAFGMPILALAIDALDRRNDRQLLVWAVLLLLVREDMGLLVAILGFIRLLQSGRRRLPAFGLMVAGVVVYVVVTSVVIPHFATEGYVYTSQYDSLGDSLPDIVLSIVTDPLHALDLLLTPIRKTQTLVYLFLPLALLPLRSPYVLLALPLLAGRMFNSRENLWIPMFHYNALPWLILVLAMVDGAHKLGFFEATDRARRIRQVLAGWMVAVLLASVTVPLAHRPRAIWEMRGALSVTGVKPTTSEWNRVLDFIPHNTCVEADNRVATHMTTRNYVSLIDTQRRTADFVVINTVAKDTGGNEGRPPLDVLSEYLAGGYVEVLRSGPVVVLRSATYAGPSDACKPLGPGKAG